MSHLEIITLKLKLANAVGLLVEAQQQMNAYRPDLMIDSDYDSVLDRMNIFLTEFDKSEV